MNKIEELEMKIRLLGELKLDAEESVTTKEHLDTPQVDISKLLVDCFNFKTKELRKELTEARNKIEIANALSTIIADNYHPDTGGTNNAVKEIMAQLKVEFY